MDSRLRGNDKFLHKPHYLDTGHKDTESCNVSSLGGATLEAT